MAKKANDVKGGKKKKDRDHREGEAAPLVG